jgi:Sigma-70 region 2
MRNADPLRMLARRRWYIPTGREGPQQVWFLDPTGNFFASHAITLIKELSTSERDPASSIATQRAALSMGATDVHNSMQCASPILVLTPEDALHPMTETPANTTSDEHLMLAFSQGSAEAFAELFARYKQPIYGFYYRRLPDPAHAEELTQETFLVLVRSAAQYQRRALFRTYLYAIALKLLRAHRRKVAFRATFFGQPNSHSDPAKVDATESAASRRRQARASGSRNPHAPRIRTA